MIRYIKQKIESALLKLLARKYGLRDVTLPDAEYPDKEKGDLAYPIGFPLAKILKKPPRKITEEIVENFPAHLFPELRKIEVGGNGYMNFWFSREAIAREIYQAPVSPEEAASEKIIVEHTNINPNKAAHVGHLRNACLGDTLVRLLRFQGYRVEVQNYIDDTGVQLADVVLGFQQRGKTTSDLSKIPGKIDYYFWDLYSEIHEWIDASPENRKERDAVLKAMEEREEPVFSLAQAIADRIIDAHLRTARRMKIEYQLLPRESDIIGLKFWEKTFHMLRENGTIVKVEEGKNAGCWVMKLSESETFEEMQNPEKIIVRSNGTVTYVGKDIAYQLWKFGLLGLNFYYRIFQKNPDGSIVWTTSTKPSSEATPNFGGADTVYNVIDTRQSYLQKVVAEGLRLLGFAEQAQKSIHFSYEMVTLSPKTALELGFVLTEEEAKKAFVEMSGRKGIGVKADDLIDHLQFLLLKRIEPLYPELDDRQMKKLAADIAVGALRYFMIRFSRNTVITFDLEDATSFEGETGPYLQYSLVRARSIFHKLQLSGFDPKAHSAGDYRDALLLLNEEPNQESDDSWLIVMKIIQIREMISKTIRTLEISLFARHSFELAQAFNNYYHKYPILPEPAGRRKLMRVALLQMFSRAMETSLDLLGIPVPEKM